MELAKRNFGKMVSPPPVPLMEQGGYLGLYQHCCPHRGSFLTGALRVPVCTPLPEEVWEPLRSGPGSSEGWGWGTRVEEGAQ